MKIENENIRTFIAIKIVPEKPLLELSRAFRNLMANESIKWVEENNYHLTLHFFGETNERQLREIITILQIISSKLGSFTFRLKGAGFFKYKNKPRVLFIKTDSNQQLYQFIEELHKQIHSLGITKRKIDFKPHLTLARIKQLKRKEPFYSLVNEFEERAIQNVTVSEIYFFQSILSSGGPVYKPIQIFKLYNAELQEN